MSHASHRLSGLGRWRTQIIVVAGVAAAATLGAGVSLAATSSPPSRTVNACENTSTHALYLRTGSKCAKGYVGLSWNIVGPKGATGKTGPQGPAGENGNNGENGTNGVSPTVLELNGTDSNCPYGGDVVTGADEIATYICNGAPGAAGQTGPQGPAGNNGTNGLSPTVTTATAQECPNGGVVITDPTSGTSYPICNGADGATGPAGAAGTDGLAGAILRYNNYPSGISPGGIATVECGDTDAVSEQYVAISGGVEVGTGTGFPTTSDLASTSQSIPVAASFPGVMDWTTNSPAAGRLDGWIIQTEVGYDANDTAATVWALCVPVADSGASSIPVQQDNNPNG